MWTLIIFLVLHFPVIGSVFKKGELTAAFTTGYRWMSSLKA